MQNNLGELFRICVSIDKTTIRKEAKENVRQKYPELLEKSDSFIWHLKKETERRFNLALQEYIKKIKKDPTEYGFAEGNLEFLDYTLNSRTINPTKNNAKEEYILFFCKAKNKPNMMKLKNEEER